VITDLGNTKQLKHKVNMHHKPVIGLLNSELYNPVLHRTDRKCGT
jgi:hypothetical protein